MPVTFCKELKNLFRYHSSKLIVSVLAVCVLLLTTCMDEKEKSKDPEPVATHTVQFDQFAGSASCAGCHKDIYTSHLQTAHFNTSQPANEKTILGSFEAGSNFHAYNSSTGIFMEKRDSGFFQVEYVNGVQKRLKRFDISIGSGTMGQSYLSWEDEYLFQLPITFFAAANRWSNSPGFANKPNFRRVITSRCLECHATYVQTNSPFGKEPEQFDRNKIVYGVDCEKCHGPAAKHVDFQTSHPDDTVGQHIINTGKLSRQLSLDLCALCHGGRLQKTTPSFEFTAGKSLTDYFKADTSHPNPEDIDVHGNQYGLMKASKCFRMSNDLTCNSCHNTHVKEKGNTALFSSRCQSCHQQGSDKFCRFKELPASELIKNCIDCHMPQKPSRAISVFVTGRETPISALIRSHYINIYPEETKKLVLSLTGKK